MSRKVKVLESWFSIDNMVLGDDASNVITEKEDYKEYLSLKSSLLANAHELWKHIDYQPQYGQNPTDTENLKEHAKKTAETSQQLSESLIQRDSIKGKISDKLVQESKQNSKITKEDVEKNVREHVRQMNIDNVLLGIPMYETNVEEHDMRGSILEEAHTLMRDAVLELVQKYVNK